MTTSENRARGRTRPTEPTVIRILNSPYAAIGAVSAAILSLVALITACWGLALAALAAAVLGCAVAAVAVLRPPRLLRKPAREQRHAANPPSAAGGVHTYYFLSETRIAMLHAQLFHGEVASELLEIVRTSSAGAEAGIDVPPVHAVTKTARDVAKKYATETKPTSTTLVADVLDALQGRRLIHEPDGDLHQVADLVAQRDADDQFLRFNVAGPDVCQAVASISDAAQDARDRTARFEQVSHGLTITLHIGSRGQQEDFDELETVDNATVIGVLRNLSTIDRTATVRVIAVY